MGIISLKCHFSMSLQTVLDGMSWYTNKILCHRKQISFISCEEEEVVVLIIIYPRTGENNSKGFILILILDNMIGY
jgi:hypothetical protein